MTVATAVAHPNIALVKYWGKRDLERNLPAVSSLSLTLDGFRTETTVQRGAEVDVVRFGGRDASDKERRRTLAFLDRLEPGRPAVVVDTANTFPTGAGLASSASGFAALVLAYEAARGGDLDRVRLSRLAREGSGSACRSLWGGFVLWRRGEAADGSDSHGQPVAAHTSLDLALLVAVVTTEGKAVGSTEGMERSRLSSPLWETWVAQAESDVDAGLAALQAGDLAVLGRVMESSTLKMHAAMMTSDPPLLYWQPGTVALLHAVWRLRASGVPCWCTMDAGPQVKVLCPRAVAAEVAEALGPHAQVVHVLGPGPDASVRVG
jgi:diphosphomevalonate decarboxylase